MAISRKKPAALARSSSWCRILSPSKTQHDQVGHKKSKTSYHSLSHLETHKINMDMDCNDGTTISNLALFIKHFSYIKKKQNATQSANIVLREINLSSFSPPPSSYLHAKNIIHRDLKSNSILVHSIEAVVLYHFFCLLTVHECTNMPPKKSRVSRNFMIKSIQGMTADWTLHKTKAVLSAIEVQSKWRDPVSVFPDWRTGWNAFYDQQSFSWSFLIAKKLKMCIHDFS